MSAVVEPVRLSGLNRQICGAAVAVTLAATVAKLGGLVKEFVVAGCYGRSDAFEAFVLAALIPGLLINLVSESMNQALVPTLVRVRELEGRNRAQQLLSNALLCSVLMLTVAAIAMGASARKLFPIFGSHYSQVKLELAIKLFYWMLPVVVLTGMASTYTAVLNTDRRFALPTLAPIVTPATTIISVWLFGHAEGIWAMVYGALAGALAHSIWMGTMLRWNGYRAIPRWHGTNEAMADVARQYGPVFLSSVVASGGLLVDQSMAAMLAPGSVSALVYAGRFVSVALALLGGAVGTVLTPVFSELIARNEWQECRKTLRVWSWSSAVIGGAVAITLIANSQWLVRHTFEHGAFGTGDTSVVSSVLTMSAIQVPFFVSSRVFYRFLIAMRRTELVFYCGLLNLALDVILNLVLMRSLGVAGIALATSLWTVSTFAFLCYWSWRIVPRVSEDSPNRLR